MAECIETETKCGKVRGIENENSIEYRSIKYANAKRWEYPEMVTSWEGIYDATEYKDCCLQRRSYEDDAVCNSFYHKEFRVGLKFTYSEDCLYLNIVTPKNPQNCPVLIYIHGGSFTGGSSNEGHLSGEDLAKKGVIYVSINYRLGPFGFCSHPDLRDENGTCGNYGLFDQYTAIKWVRENISAFGGDPEHITLMGQSAGAMSVDIHTTTSLEKGWLSGAVLCSGAALQRFLLKPLKPEKTVKFWNKVMVNAGVSSMAELKKIDDKKLFYAWHKACGAGILTMPYMFPVYDGKLLKKEEFNSKNICDMPYLIGMTIADMFPYFLMQTVKSWAKKCENHKNKCYTYIFSRDLPGDSRGAYHASDLLYFFKTLGNNWRPFEKIDYEISDQMADCLAAFVKNSDPSCESVPNWNCSAKKPLTFCEHTSAQKWDVWTLIKNTITKGFTI